MTIDRSNTERDEPDAGEVYWTDLRLIRESKGVPIRSVHERTRIPIEVLDGFERAGLSRRRTFNVVYRRSLAAAYAEAIGIDPDDVLRSLEETDMGRYKGRLAQRYLNGNSSRSN